MKNKKLRISFSTGWLLSLFCLFFLAACVVSAGVYSRGLQHNMEVENIFQQGSLLPDHTYYILGTYPEPEAIIAVSNSFQLQSRLWTKVDWTKKELSTAVFWMQNAEMGFCSTNGGYLVAPDGQQVGIWYSQRDVSFVKQPAAGVIEIYPFEFQPGSPCERQFLIDQL